MTSPSFVECPFYQEIHIVCLLHTGVLQYLICWNVARLTDPLHLAQEIPGRVIQLVLVTFVKSLLDPGVPPELHHDGGQLGREDLGVLHVGGLMDEDL